MRPLFSIYHPEQGEKKCDDVLWPTFKAAGWKRGKDEVPAASDDSDKAPEETGDAGEASSTDSGEPSDLES